MTSEPIRVLMWTHKSKGFEDDIEYEEQDEKCGAFNVAVMKNYMLVHI